MTDMIKTIPIPNNQIISSARWIKRRTASNFKLAKHVVITSMINFKLNQLEGQLAINPY